MLKTFKKILCTFLVVLMCLTSAPLDGFVGVEWPNIGEWFVDLASAKEATIIGSCGENVSYTFNQSTGELIISGTGPMSDYPNNDSPFQGLNEKKVVIESGVTTVGLNAFQGSPSLVKVELADSVTCLRSAAFDSCTNLAEITIPNSVTKIEYGAFAVCTSLTSISIPDSVTTIESFAFYGCDSIETIKIGSGLASVGDEAFNYCSNIKIFQVSENNDNYSSDDEGVLFNKDKTILFNYPGGNENISYVVPKSVIEIWSNAFSGCQNLESITLGEYLEVIGYALINCDSIVNIKVDPNNKYYSNDEKGVLFNKDKTKLIKYPAKNMRSNYDIPDSVIEIEERAFYKSGNLTAIDIHDNIRSIGFEAFGLCTALESVIIGKDVENIVDRAFSDCYNLQDFTVKKENEYYSNDKYGVLYDKDKTTVIQYPIGNSETSYDVPDCVKVIKQYAFEDSYLRNITLGKSLETISFNAFSDCSQLESIVIPSNVKQIEDAAFFRCSALKNLIIENGINNIGVFAFAYCTALTEIIIPNSISEINYGVFDGCTNITDVRIPVTVESILDFAFSDCINLKDIYYEGTKTQWNEIQISETYNEPLFSATIHYEYKEPDELVSDKNYSISAYSSKPKLALLPGKALSMLFKLNFDDGRNKYIVADSSFNFTVSDDDVISIENIVSSSDQTSLIVKTHNSGTAVLTVSAYENGEYKTISKYTIDVFGTDVYHANNFEYTEGDINHNFISNGVFIDDFQIEYNEDDTCNVTFTAYNTENAIAIASVYDSKGKLLKTKNIDRFFGEAPTDLYDTATGLYENLPDLFSDDPLYQQSIWSEETKVAFKNIPCTGRIEITNDCSISINAALNNYCSIFIATLCEYISLADYIGSIPDFKVNTMATQKMVDIVENAISKLAEDEAMLITDYILNLGLNLSDEMSIVDGSMLEYVEAFEMFLGVLIRLNIGFDEIIDILYETLVDVGMGVIESAFFDALKLPGALMEAAFMCFRAADITDHYQTVGKFIGSGETSVYLDNKEDRYALSSNDYTVSGEWYFDSAVSFHQYMITNGEDLDDVNENFDDFTHIQVIGMSLYKNGKEIQPSGEVEVAIPIPSGVIIDTLEIYRKEDNGAYTKLDYIVDGNYLIFKTHHFSVYCIVGEYEKIDSLSLSEASITVELNELVKLHEIVSGAVGGKNLVWSTSDAEIVKVSDIGVIRGLKEGVATITVVTADGTLKASCVVTVVHEHSFGEWVEIKAANCTEFGVQQHNCLCCDYFETKTSSALGHSFEDGQSKCNNCDYNKADSCSCNCHKGGIVGFFFKLILFFQKIFKSNKVCSCGVYHY